MRCPDCNKFVSLEMQEPEVDVSVEHSFDETAQVHTYVVSGTVRIVRSCADCGQEMKESTLDVEVEKEVPAADLPEGIAADDCDVTDELESLEEGGGRYAKSYFGAQGTFTINIGALHSGKAHTVTVEWSDKVAASSMDELV